MKVYRVEHYDRRHGPYAASWDSMNNECQKLADVLRVTSTWEQHPPPDHDGILHYNHQHHCGFASLDALFDWFEQWLEGLIECDYHIAVFEVDEDDVLIGEKQVMFKRKQHRRKQTIRLNEVKK
jgi:hypothetical protein